MPLNKNYKATKFEHFRGEDYFFSRLLNQPYAEPNQLYEETYWGSVIDPDNEARDRLSEEERLKFLKNSRTELAAINDRKPGRLLDVGCGPGYLLSGIDASWDRHGVEMSTLAAGWAEKWGRIHLGTLESAGYPDQFFDVVVLYHVIEHLENPASLIKEVRRILNPDGLLILGTPDFDSGCARRFGERFRLLHDSTHISLFSEQSLRRFLRDSGFVIKHVDHPFFETTYFTKVNLDRLFDVHQVSPPFIGNVVTFYCRLMTANEARDMLSYMKNCFLEVFGSDF